MEKEFNYVYITTNLSNNKQYIGSHSTNKVDDNYLGSGRYFLKALKKEGIKNFKREILQECNDILEARELEGDYIKKYNTLYPNGYNLSPMGGIGFKGAFHSENTRKKQSEWQKGKTYEELYGIEKAAKMKEKQRQRKLGITTKRKGKGFKQEFIEKYGKENGVIRYNEFIQKQREQKIGKPHKSYKQCLIDKFGEIEGLKLWENYKKQNNKFFNIKGKTHPSWGKTYSIERIEKAKKGILLSFYKRLDKEKLLIIKKLFNENKTYKEMTTKTGYGINKIKRIIKEELWGA